MPTDPKRRVLTKPTSTALVPRRASIEGNLAAVFGQFQLGEETTDVGRLRVDSREILAATTRLIGARLGELEVDTHIVVTTRYVERGTPDDFMADLTKGAVVRALYGPSKAKHGGKNLENVHRALVNLYRLEVQFEGFNAITGEHDPDLASMSRLYTDLVFDRQIGFDDPVSLSLAGATGNPEARQIVTSLPEGRIRSKVRTGGVAVIQQS